MSTHFFLNALLFEFITTPNFSLAVGLYVLMTACPRAPCRVEHILVNNSFVDGNNIIFTIIDSLNSSFISN